ncbi:hypothetical protein HKK80_10190 [Halonotius sp. F2-221B]|uniref:hypothetical protein n=1 Tax=Halonotius sp. F2-221B TaxID=2731620 RepID=UPI00398A96B5
MNRYLLSEPTAADGETTRVSIDSRVGIYRRGDGSKAIVAETADEQIDLGVRDATVSRKTNGRPPVALSPISRGISVRNHGSTNPVTLSTNLRTHKLTAGDAAAITDDCRLTIGLSLTLRATVEGEGSRQNSQAQSAGVRPAAHARTLANALRTASEDSVAETRGVISELRTFLQEHPLERAEYESVCAQVDRIEQRLESKASGLHRTEHLDEEWQSELAVVSDRIESIYARSDR